MSGAARRPPGLVVPSRPPGEATRAAWLPLLAGLLGICALLYVFPQLAALADTRGFRPAPATLESVQRQVFPASRSFAGHKKFRPWTEEREAITYRYSVAGQSYLGSDTVSAPRPRGRGPLTIYYDPADPTRSVARRPAAWPALAGLALALALLLYGFRGLRRVRGAALRR
jgi:hypothetical protein